MLGAAQGVERRHANQRIGHPEEVLAHRWTFAQPTTSRDRTFLLDGSGIALCGDGWSERSKVEAAWLSGDDLGAAIVERLVHG